jgi:hypothetical protein
VFEHGKNLISYVGADGAEIGEALPDDFEDHVLEIIGEGVAAMQDANGDWMGSLQNWKILSGYWIGIDIFPLEFSFESDGLTRNSVQPKVRAVPELYSFNQSTRQAFYFIESASIMGQSLDSDDIIIAYNGDVVVGSRYWNGEYTDVPAIGYDEYTEYEGYCKPGDKLEFTISFILCIFIIPNSRYICILTIPITRTNHYISIIGYDNIITIK